MQKTMIATLMAVGLGLISMPAVQAAPASGSAIGTAAGTVSPIQNAQYYRYRRYRRRCWWVHRYYSRRFRVCS
jgi:hypothetical protein